MKLTLNQIILEVYKRNETKVNKLNNNILIKSISNTFNVKEELVASQIEYNESFYLDYINNYLTCDGMCEDYYISIELCNELIELGKLINHNR